jgi:DNA-binding GntR family transcriptional regulator
MVATKRTEAEPSLEEILQAGLGERTGTAERVANVLRLQIIEGHVRPGARITEDLASRALGVSRNTLREAFQLLSHERLLVHELGRGVFVRQLSIEDLQDLYAVRLQIECGAVRSATAPTPAELDAIRQTVTDAREAAATEDWQDVGTASIQFHLSVSDLARSERMSAFMRQVMAEFRLIFPLLGDDPEPYKRYMGRHATILSQLEAGNRGSAEDELRAYLGDSRTYLCALYASRTAPDS